MMCYVIRAFVSLYRKHSSETDPAELWGWKKHGVSATGAARLWWSANCVVFLWHGSLWRNFVPPKSYRFSCGSQKLMVAGAGSARWTFGVVRDLTIPSEWWPWGMVCRIMHRSISTPLGSSQILPFPRAIPLSVPTAESHRVHVSAWDRPASFCFLLTALHTANSFGHVHFFSFKHFSLQKDF